ncbi:MAG TPA: twin-arginine translocase subunit TatC, partial [Flexilinea sp.]|nr:twin-arginine translocase subunit TatC [Flexilinea sp.]
IVIVLSLCFAIIIAFFFSDSIMAFLARPIGGLEKLQSIEITENFTAVFRVALLAGLVLDSPIIFYEILAFILPALKSNEKRILFTFLPLLILFFIAGILFAFFILLPAAIPFLTSFTDIPTTIRTNSYFSFTTNMLFWIGIVFEMPIFIYFLTKVKIVNSGLLLKNWRQAVVICAILAMLITPTVDPVNMTILLIPLVLLYFLSILFAKIAER